MAVLYVKEQGAILQKRGERLLVSKNGKSLLEMPLYQIESIMVIGNVQLTSQAVQTLLQNGIDVVYMTFSGKYLGRTAAESSKNIFLRLAQYEIYQNMEKRLAFAKQIVFSKIENQRQLIKNWRWDPGDQEWKTEIKQIEELQKKVFTAERTGKLMGLEGMASNLYFRSFGRMFKCEFRFDGRNRRPPRDPINVMISLGYTLGKDGKQIPAKAEENLSTSLEDVFFNRKTTLQEKLKKGSEILNGWEQYYKDQRPIGSIQEFVVVVYMMQNHVDGKLDFLRETRRKFTNVSQSICEYMAKFWKMHDRLDDALWEYEQFFELTGLDGEQKIADPERFLSYFEELIVREQEEIWTELMQEYSDAGAYNRAAAIMKKIERLKTRPAVLDLSGEAAGAEADAIRPGQMTGEWLAAYSALFVARDDVYGEEEILAGNKRQVVPKLEPLTDEVLKTHFSGKKTIASYVQRTNQTVKYLVIDVDVSKRLLLMGSEQEQIRKYLPRAAERAAEVLKILERMGLHGYVENSGYRGYHIWVFFTEWIPVRYVVILEYVLEEKLEKTDDDISIEFFPNRSRIRNGSYGQSIKLPGGMHIKSGKRSGFCNEQFAPVEMSYEFLTGIAKYTLMAVKKILGTMSGTEKEPKKRELSLELEGFAELPPSVKVVLEKCNLVRYLCQKAQTTGYLSHFERLTILYVFGHLGEEGKTFVHTVMEFTLNYQYHVTEKFIQKLPAKPVSCVKLRDQYKQITAEYGCSCNFRRTKNCYPSPVLHALKNSSDVADDITIPTSRTLTKKVEEKVIEEINIHKKVQDLAVRIVEMKKQKRGVEKKIQKVENELETIYDQAGVDCLEVDMGMLVRRKKGQGYEWLIEI